MPSLREVRADYDDATIIVYQAYNAAIASAAVAAGRFVAPFSMNRMTWVKPSFLWMMERCGYATKPNQEHVLRVRMTRAGFEQALSMAALTSGDTGPAPVRVQWDPERNLRGGELEHRSIQVGIGRQVVQRFVDEWVVGLEDITPRVARLRELRREGAWEHAERLLPVERLYPLPEPIRTRLRATA
jgi:hypothetical protein